MTLFGIDESKKPIELSEGMKVKFNMVVASDEVGIALIPAELFESKMQELMEKL